MEKPSGNLEENVQHIQDDSDVLAIQEQLEKSHAGGYVPVTTEEKHQSRALNRKFDIFVLPICVLIYLLNGLDRSNLGNAATAGFTNDLGIPADTINTATSLFFCTVSKRKANRTLSFRLFSCSVLDTDCISSSRFNRYRSLLASVSDKRSGYHSSVQAGAF